MPIERDTCTECSKPLAAQSDVNPTAVWQDGGLCWRDFGGCEAEDWKKNPVQAVAADRKATLEWLRARGGHLQTAKDLEAHWQEETDGK